jgi:hypothetical protein
MAAAALSAPALAGGGSAYTSPQYRFTLAAPPGYEVKAVSPQDIDLTRRGKTVFSLRVDDQLVWFIHKRTNPGQSLIVSRPGDDAMARLSQKARESDVYFRDYARLQAANWCTADGPDGSRYCKDIDREEHSTTPHGLPFLVFHLTMTHEDFSRKTVQKTPVGPVYAVYVAAAARPLVLVVTPPPGALAPGGAVRAAQELINSILPLS